MVNSGREIRSSDINDLDRRLQVVEKISAVPPLEIVDSYSSKAIRFTGDVSKQCIVQVTGVPAQITAFEILADDAATTYSVTLGGMTVSVTGGGGAGATATALAAALNAAVAPFNYATWTVDFTTEIVWTITTTPPAGFLFWPVVMACGGTGTIDSLYASTGKYPAREAFLNPGDGSYTYGANCWFEDLNNNAPYPTNSQFILNNYYLGLFDGYDDFQNKVYCNSGVEATHVLWTGDPAVNGLWPATIGQYEPAGNNWLDGPDCWYYNPNNVPPLWDVDVYLTKPIGVGGCPVRTIYGDGLVPILCRGTFAGTGGIALDGSWTDILVIDGYFEAGWLTFWSGSVSATLSSCSSTAPIVNLQIIEDVRGVQASQSCGYVSAGLTGLLGGTPEPAFGEFSLQGRTFQSGYSGNPIRLQAAVNTAAGVFTAASIDVGNVNLIQVHDGSV